MSSSADPSEATEKDITDESLVSEGTTTTTDYGTAEHRAVERGTTIGLGDEEEGAGLDSVEAGPEPSTKERRAPVPLDLGAASPVRERRGAEEEEEKADDNDDDEQVISLPPLTTKPSSGRATPLTPISPVPFTKEPQPWDLIEPPPDNNALRSAEEGLSPHTNTNTTALPFGIITKRNPKIPKSSYYFGPPPANAAYGTPPMGIIGIHHPREIVRIERDYSTGEAIPQFAPIWPLELEGRITPTQFLSSINEINEILISAHSIGHTFLDNALEIFSLGISNLFVTTWYKKEMKRLEKLFTALNDEVYNPAGLNILWPRSVGFLFMEIEYY